MAKLVFDIDALKPIAAHARESKAHRATFGMFFDPTLWKEGAAPNAEGWVEPDQIDNSKIPAHLQLVKDRGVYLMSSGLPRLLDASDGAGKRALVAYAQGLGPNDPWDAWQRVSGDDFVEQIDLAFVEKAIALGARHLNVHLSADKVALDFDHAVARELPSYNSSELKRIHELSGSTARPKWAEPGKAYSGAIFGYDTNVVMQKVGRGLVIHDKALLEEIPQKGSKVLITYGAGEKATVALATRKRARAQAPTMDP